MKSKCRSCKTSLEVSSAEFFSVSAESQAAIVPRARPMLFVEILSSHGRGFVDTAAKLSVAGSRLYEILLNKGQLFTKDMLNMRLADGSSKREHVLIANVVVKLKERSIPTVFIVLPESDNYTLFGIDFIQDAKIVINAAQQSWHFADHPSVEYYLSFEILEVCQPIGLGSISALRAEEGCTLIDQERSRLAALLSENEDIFKQEGEATPYVEHCIDTGDCQPIAVPLHRMSTRNKEILKKEIDRMMDEGIIEECESPWAAPFVLVPKKSGDVRVCVDYRRLNSITLPDAYSLPRMDDLLHNTKRTRKKPYIANTLCEARDTNEKQQDRQKVYADSRRTDVAGYESGDLVLVSTHNVMLQPEELLNSNLVEMVHMQSLKRYRRQLIKLLIRMT